MLKRLSYAAVGLIATAALAYAATTTLTLGTNTGPGGVLILEGSTSGAVTVQPAAAAGSGTLFQLPATNGSANQFLQTDGSGVLTWATASGSGTVTTTGSPANGNLTKFTGASSISNGDLSGDCTTSGTLAITCTKTSGTSFGALATTVAGSNVATAAAVNLSAAGGLAKVEVALGQQALGTSSISTNTCATVITISATGVATTDIINIGYSSDPTGVTGYAPGGGLSIVAYPTSNNVNIKVCNNSGGSVTPGALTINYAVWR